MAATPRRKRPRRLGATALMLFALGAGLLGGAGGTATMQWFAGPGSTTTVVAAPPASGGTQLVDTSALTAPSVASAVYSEVGPAVVQINVAGQSRGRLALSGSGSGVVIDGSGLVLTNYHVVEGGRVISVLFSTGESREAQVLGTDSANDLALLQVDLPAGVPAAALGNSEQVEVGEVAIAIGSPFGLDQTVTQGIVSAVDRDWAASNRTFYRDLIQTDAPINPGNSGGPLVNANGEVIGINSMIESPISGSVGIGFAVPINTAKRLLPQLESGAQLERAWLGISGMDVAQAVDLGEQYPVDSGVLVASVVSNSPAAAAGLRGGQGENAAGGDIIVAVGGQEVTGMGQLAELIGGFQPGDEVTLTIIRGNQRLETTAQLRAWPSA